MNGETIPTIFLLKNPVQRYAWGSKQWIQDMLSLPESERQSPMAELWMGAHPRAPSMVILGKTEQPLDKVIQRDPALYLGEETAKQYTTLPFLFKLLAAASPLSIQAHPDKKQAEEGFAREEAAGIPLSAEIRNYKDPNHKPEIICALTPFTAMCGFREGDEIVKLLSLLELPLLQESLGALKQSDTAAAYRLFLRSLFDLPLEKRHELSRLTLRKLPQLETRHPEFAREWSLVKQFCSQYPGDRAILSPLYLNVLALAPGEALFLPAGILHAYVYGFGVELMANSDNVIRGGLTPKHIDVEELLRILRFEPFKPEILQAIETVNGTSVYPSPVKEFSLFRIDLEEPQFKNLPPGKPAILIVLEGTVRMSTNEQNIELQKGMSVFLPATRGVLTLSGSGTIFGASTGTGFA